MKLNCCLLAIALVLPAAASPTTYNMTFTGGFYLNLDSPPIPFAPKSASFAYDPAGGFSSFIVQYDGDTFDLTSSANAPLLCNDLGLSCSSGSAANAFTALTENPTWLSYESYRGTSIVTNLVLAPYGSSNLGAISASGPGFSGFTPGQSDLVRSGTFTYASTSGSGPNPGPNPNPGPDPDPTPGPSVPEPGVAQMLSLAGLGLLCCNWLRRRNGGQSSAG